MENVDPVVNGDVSADNSREMQFMAKTTESEKIKDNVDSFVPELDGAFSRASGRFRGSVPADIKLGFE